MAMIDLSDLTPFKASELKIGGIYWRKDPDGYHKCCITEADTKGPYAGELRVLTEYYSKEGRLFRRISRPWEGF